MVKKILTISLVTKILKKVGLYVYFVHKGLYIKNILMKIDILNFLIKQEKGFVKYMENLEKVSIPSKTNLIVNLYIAKNM